MFKKLAASVAVSLGVLLGAFGLGTVGTAGAVPVSCGWWQSHVSTIVYQCVQDGNHVTVHSWTDIGGGNFNVYLEYEAWLPAWQGFQMTHGNFAGTPSYIKHCPTSSAGGITNLYNRAHTPVSAGWEHGFWRSFLLPSGAIGTNHEGAFNHRHVAFGIQPFGSEVNDVAGQCTPGLGFYLTLG